MTEEERPCPPSTDAPRPARVRPIDGHSEREVAWVASRMRATLSEVIGEEEGREMYSLAWLEERVRWHLDPGNCSGQVLLAERADGEIIGHTIVRLESDDEGDDFGLFSTVYVAPDARNRSVATALLGHGEAWMRTHGLSRAATYTASDNTKLITLFEKHGYALSRSSRPDMVILSRVLDGPATATSNAVKS